MADVRCPMCGKPNPADAEVCRYCQARLKPLTGGQPPAITPGGQPPAGPAEGQSQGAAPGGPPPEDSSTDWLHGLLGSSSETEELGESPAPEGEEESSDWLARIRQRSREEQDALSKIGTPPEIHETPEAPEESPDWLREIGDDPTASSANADDVSAWLDSLRDHDEAEPTAPAEPAPPAAAQPPAPAEEPSDEDWLHNLASSGFSSEFPEPEAGTTAEGAPVAPQETSEPEAIPADIPDWLRDFDPPATLPEAEPPAPAESTPEWRADLTSEPPAEPAAEPADLPGWLQDLQPPELEARVQAAASQEPAGPEEPAAAPAEDLPDWLRDMQSPGLEAQAQAPASPGMPAESATAGEIPDWPSDVPSEGWRQTLQPPAEPEALEAPAPAEEIPDWLREPTDTAPFEPVAAAPVEPVETAPLQEPGQPEPDWISEFSALPPETPVEPAVPAALEEDIPEWLRDFQAAAPGPESLAQAPATPPQEEVPAAFTTAPVEPISPFSGEALPDWMSSETTAPQGSVSPFTDEESAAEPTPPFASADINELLAGVTSEQSAANEKISGPEAEPLAPAELPNWLQAMRPIESAMANVPSPAEEDDQRLEKSGPLAGLRGVLPGEELVTQYRKPPVYTNKLRVSDKQHLHTGLLEAILADEAKSQPAPGEPTQAHQTILRALAAAVLILLIVIPSLAGLRLPVPANLAASQPAMAAAYSSVNDLSAGATVLVVSDFEAGLIGEMRAAAEPLLRHLQTRQPRIVLASTVPAGPVLGEMLLKESGISALVNLGYVAGGSSALRLFGIRAGPDQPAPLQQAAPFPYNKTWGDPALQNLRDITAFQRIILLTDSVETTRNWMEQVQPALGSNTQLLVVSSAQVAPLVRAYVESGQARGLVSGLNGGLAYEQLARQSGLATTSWTAYQLSLITVIILIVVGGFIAGISALFRRSSTQRKA